MIRLKEPTMQRPKLEGQLGRKLKVNKLPSVLQNLVLQRQRSST